MSFKEPSFSSARAFSTSAQPLSHIAMALNLSVQIHLGQGLAVQVLCLFGGRLVICTLFIYLLSPGLTDSLPCCGPGSLGPNGDLMRALRPLQ